ncbi:hypothetical protein LXL04_031213 [Taraxacum kok-saghyz]
MIQFRFALYNMEKPTKSGLALQHKIVDARSTTSLSTPDRMSSLYVGDLEENVNEGQLFDLFNEVGRVHSVRVCRDQENGVSLGYGYVNFTTSEDATIALKFLNFKRLHGKQIRIMFSEPDPTMRRSGVGNVYIKNLDSSIDNKELYEAFCAFGNVSTCKVVVDSHGVSKGFGFIQFEKDEDAQIAIKNLNGVSIKGKQVYVGKFIRQEEWNDAKRSLKLTELAHANLYTKNLDETITDDEKLKALFSEFGTITSCKIMIDSRGVSKGFGFVAFSTGEEAKKAMAEMNRKMVGRKPLYVSVSERKEERMARLQAQFSQARASSSVTMTQQPIMAPIRITELVGSCSDVHLSGPIETGRSLASVLASASPENQRRILGEYLHPLVEEIEHKNATSVTGVLLEMDNDEVLHLIESPDELKKKVGEAMALLVSSSSCVVANVGDQFPSLTFFLSASSSSHTSSSYFLTYDMSRSRHISLCKFLSRYPSRTPSKPTSLIPFKTITTKSCHPFSNPTTFRPSSSCFEKTSYSQFKISRPYTAETDKVVDEINMKFAEAREEIESAMESKETVYFNEEAECARAVVKEVLDLYEGLLSRLAEKERGVIQRSMGLKIEQLKAELQQLND